MEKLIGMREFVLIEEQNQNYDSYNRNLRYANFISQPLTLNMFVPCSEDGVILEEPKNWKQWIKKELNTPYDAYLSKYEQYQTALEKVLFEGFEINEALKGYRKNIPKSIALNDILHIYWFNEITQTWDISVGLQTIEDLTKYNLTLTQSAINQLKL